MQRNMKISHDFIQKTLSLVEQKPKKWVTRILTHHKRMIKIHEHVGKIINGWSTDRITFKETSLKERVTLISDLEQYQKEIHSLMKELSLKKNEFSKEILKLKEIESQISQRLSLEKCKVETLNKPLDFERTHSPQEVEYINKFSNVDFRISMSPFPLLPVHSNSIEPDKSEQFVLRHPTECQPIVREMLQKTRYVTQEEFEKELKGQIDHFNEYLKGFQEDKRDFVIVVQRHKSSFYAANLGLKFLDRPPQAILTEEELKSYVSTHKNASHILCIDDAAYSGTQMSQYMKKDYMSALESMDRPNLFLAIPFQTTQGHGKILEAKRGMVEEDSKVRVTIPTNFSKMESIEDSFSDSKTKEMILSMYGTQRLLDTQTLTYFPHKIADNLSTLEGFLSGNVFDSNGSYIDHFPLMQMPIPPYKGLSYILLMASDYDQNPDHIKFIKNHPFGESLNEKILFFKADIGAYLINRIALENHLDPLENHVMMELKKDDRIAVPVWNEKGGREVMVGLRYDGNELVGVL